MVIQGEDDHWVGIVPMKVSYGMNRRALHNVAIWSLQVRRKSSIWLDVASLMSSLVGPESSHGFEPWETDSRLFRKS